MGTWSARSLLLAARSLKSRGWPRRNTGIPAMVMSTRDGSKGTPARPAAAKTRPQLGSAPAKAVFTRGEVATVSAMRRAASSVLAPRTSISITRCAPSPSATICRAREWQTCSSAAVKSRCALLPLLIAGAPASPLARTRRASFVDVSPSMLMELNVRAVTSLRVFCSSEGAIAASVVTKAGVVAMLGWIMPAPLAQPTKWMRLPAILKEAAAVFGRVSVVQMASDTSANERAEERRWRASSGTARSILSSANGTPMTPVEQTKTSSDLQPRRFAVSATVRTAAAYPAAPVAQLALPAFTTTARMRPRSAQVLFGNQHGSGDHKGLREYSRRGGENVA